MNIKISKIYDYIVCFLMYWCILQEILISLIYKITNSILIANILFYSKDILMIILFIWAFFKNRNNKRILQLVFVYLLYVFAVVLITVAGGFNISLSATEIFKNTRNVILLPVFVFIGYGINDRESFKKIIIERLFPFIVFCTVIGIAEYLLDIFVGTKTLWTDVIGYTRFYVDIKHQSGNMYMGLPANFYGSYGNGFFSTKRLVGFWANPLTSAYNMAIPLVYYVIRLFESFGKKVITIIDIKNILFACIMFIALWLTHTRAILILIVVVSAYYLLVYSKKKIWLFLGVVFLTFGLIFLVDFHSIMAFLYDGSTAGHIISIVESIKNMNWSLIGNGMGYMGIYGYIATENVFLTLIGNLGLIGLTLYVLIYLTCFYLCKKNIDKGENTLMTAIFLSSIMYFISGIVSEQLFAFTTIASFYILFGFSCKKELKIS